MDKERMAHREFLGTDRAPEKLCYTVMVSGKRVELLRKWEEEWDNESGTGRDTGHDLWEMNLDDLKRLIDAAQWCIEKSEAFEANHPVVVSEKKK